MSLLTIIFFWFAGSCVATPIIGALLSRALGGQSESRGTNRLADFRPRLDTDRIVTRSPSLDAIPSRAYARRPLSWAPAQRNWARSRR